jgi:hypothetical protein
MMMIGGTLSVVPDDPRRRLADRPRSCKFKVHGRDGHPEGTAGMSTDTGTDVRVILEHPATPEETMALSRAFADFGIAARLRAAPRRRAVEGSAWRVVISTPLHELLGALPGPRAASAARLRGLVERISAAWSGGPVGHVEVGPRGVDRRATGGVLLTHDLPPAAYDQLVRTASRTLDSDRLFLWDPDSCGWRTFDVDAPVPARSAGERGDDARREGVELRFGRVG